MTTYLRTFETRADVLSILALAGLGGLATETTPEWHDETCVDVFELQTKVGWQWTANLAMECPDALKPYEAFPAFPKRVFAGLRDD